MKLKSISAPKKVFTLMGLIILIFIIAVGLYITSPSASVSSMKDEAVSYTHLRAHETVLDLVCRLLLEKKKENTNRSVVYFTSDTDTDTNINHLRNQ